MSYSSKQLSTVENLKQSIKASKRLFNQFQDKLSGPFIDRDIDVYLISYPNSGRTWFRLLIGKALCDKYNIDESFILNTKDLSEAAGILKTTFTHDCSLVDNNLSNFYYTQEMFFNKGKYKDKSIILLFRDPRDVMVSYYFQQTKRDKNYQGSISEFIRSDKFGIEKLLSFNKLWLDNQKYFKNFLVFSYEQAYLNTVDCLYKTLEFMGAKELDSKNLESSVEFSSFQNMKKLEKERYFSDYSGGQQMTPRNAEDNNSFKARKGKVGGYVDHLKPEDIEYINQKILQANLPIYCDLSFD